MIRLEDKSVTIIMKITSIYLQALCICNRQIHFLLSLDLLLFHLPAHLSCFQCSIQTISEHLRSV